jgi:hypothetical protein
MRALNVHQGDDVPFALVVVKQFVPIHGMGQQ